MMKKLMIATLCLGAMAAPVKAEFDGPRVYWPLPKNTNIISLSRFEGEANLSFTALNQYQGSLDVRPDMFVLGYTRVQPLFGRTIYWQALLPFGSLDTDSSLPLGATNTYTDGIGDFQLGATVNILGTPELPVREFLRHDQSFSLGVGVMATFPTGDYDPDEALNVGSNRYSLRLSAPMVYSLGDWVPGQRMTLELMPSVRIFGDNEDNLGQTVEQDPLFGLEAHLTRDVTTQAFASVDYTYLSGGEQTFRDNGGGGVTDTTDGLDAHFLGATFGMNINDNMALRISHMQSVGGSSGDLDIDGSLTRFQFVWSWHDVLEKRRDW